MTYLIYHCMRLLHGSRQWLWQQLTPTGLGVLICMIVAGILGSSTSMLRLLCFLALSLLGLAAISSRWIHYQFRARRILPRFGTVGEPLRYTVVLEKVTPPGQRGLKLIEMPVQRFPRFQMLQQFATCYPGFGNWWSPWWQHVTRQRPAMADPQDLPPVLMATKTKAKVELLPLKRGYLELNRLSLACPDPLGLVYRHHTARIPQSVCILPQRYQLPALSLAKGRHIQIGGSTLVSSMGEALEFRSLRDYRPGDPTNKIHWKSWAKVGYPVVREHQEEAALHYALILDSFQPKYVPGDTRNDVFEAALAVAVSFLTREQPEETRLDVIYAASAPPSPTLPCAQYVTVGRGLRQRAQILETLATLNLCHDQELASLAPVVQTRLPHLSGCICILISPDQARLDFLKTLALYGIPIKAMVLCQQKVDPATSLADELPPHCLVNFVSLQQIQQDLLAL
jgi:uncharacterized protein (DUF58 family)